MTDSVREPVNERLARVERRLRFFEIAVIILIFGLVLTTAAGLRPRSVRAGESARILRVRGIIVEDASGRARILIGAPVPEVKERARTAQTVGLVVLGRNGADRVAVGAPTPNPQVRGRVLKRVGAESGIVIDDKDGNERGGFGVLDNDSRGIECLDYPSGTGGEAICLAVQPGEGASFSISTPSGEQSAKFIAHADLAPKLVFGNVSRGSTLNLRVLRVNSETTRGLTFDLKKSSEKAIMEELDKLQP